MLSSGRDSPKSLKNQTNMADTRDSQARLDAVLDRIEAAAHRLRQARREAAAETEGQSQQIADLIAEREELSSQIATLQAENERLGQELQRAKADRAEAKQTAERVSGRLDGAIDQLKLVLEH